MSTDTTMTPEELATFLKVPIRTVYRYVQNGSIPFLRINARRVRFSKSDVVTALSKRGLSPTKMER